MKSLRHWFFAITVLLELAPSAFAHNGLQHNSLADIACFGGAAFCIVAIPLFFFLRTMQKALNRISPRNRLMNPAMVWLMLAPGIHIVWQFMIAMRIPDSLKREMSERGQDNGSDYGKAIGVTLCIVNIFGLLVRISLRFALNGDSDSDMAFTFLFLVPSVVLGVLFWVRVAWHSSKLDGAVPMELIEAGSVADGQPIEASPDGKARARRMKSINECAGQVLERSQTSYGSSRRKFNLFARHDLVATLREAGSLTVVEIGDKSFTFVRSGFFTRTITVFAGDDEVAVFAADVLQMTNGTRYCTRSGLAQMSFCNGAGQPLVQYRCQWFVIRPSIVEITSAGAAELQLPLLVALTWYLSIEAEDSADAGAVGG